MHKEIRHVFVVEMNGSSKTTKCFVGLVNNNVCELRTSCLVCLLCLWLDYTMQPFNNSHPNAMIILVMLIIIYRHTQPTTSLEKCVLFLLVPVQLAQHNTTKQRLHTLETFVYAPVVFVVVFSALPPIQRLLTKSSWKTHFHLYFVFFNPSLFTIPILYLPLLAYQHFEKPTLWMNIHTKPFSISCIKKFTKCSILSSLRNTCHAMHATYLACGKNDGHSIITIL